MLGNSSRYVESRLLYLVLQGLRLHFASFWGPLRVSNSYRRSHKNWLSLVVRRFWKEYGLNLILFLALCLMVSTLFPQTFWVVGWVVSLLCLPVLAVAQMFVDSIRKDVTVLHDVEKTAGMTVKTFSIKGTQCWGFFNHFALPVGFRKGTDLRSWVHESVKESHGVLVCRAQSLSVAKYYLNERPSGVNLGGDKPLLVWDYSGNDGMYTEDDFKVNRDGWFKALIGWHKLENSGQV